MANWYELSGSPVEEENVNPITNYNQITTSTQEGNWWESEHDARTNYNLLNDPNLLSGNWWDLGITPLDNTTSGPPEGAFGTLVYLFDASVASSFTLEGNSVKEWTDLSDNGIVLTDLGAGSEPTLTTDGPNPAVLFDGVDDQLANTSVGLSSGINRTMFSVARATDRASLHYVMETLTLAGAFMTESVVRTTDIRMTHFPDDGSSSRMNIPNTDTLIHIWIARHDDLTTGTMLLDDGSTDDDVTVGTLRTDINQFIIGAQATGLNKMAGYIMSVGAYEERLDDTATTALMDFLKSKWNV